MSSSTRSKSQHGTNGPEETPVEESSSSPKLLNPSPESPPTVKVAEAVAVEHKPKPFRSGKIFLSCQDIKLAKKMSGDISKSLGLNSRSRSYRV